ncbi:MAG: flagellar hook-length control protein FliK [Thermogutta sp.]|nr:flagellar hook-length control protein FliK [Thermogutta sp.]
MAEVTVDRGEVGLECLRITFAERGGKVLGMDSAFAELLQTQVEDSVQKASAARADARWAASRSAQSGVSSSRPELEPPEADEDQDDAKDDKEADDVRAEESSKAWDDNAVTAEGQVAVGEERQPDEGAQSGSAGADPDSHDRDKRGSADSAAKSGSQIESELAPKQSSARRDGDDPAGGKAGVEGLEGTATAEAGAAAEGTTIGPSDLSQIAGDQAESPSRRNSKAENGGKVPEKGIDPLAEGDRATGPISEGPADNERLPAAADGAGNPVFLSALGAAGRERGKTDETLNPERGRGRGRRQVQKGDAQGRENSHRFQPPAGMQGSPPPGVVDRPAAVPIAAPIAAENPGILVASAVATNAAAAAAESSTAASAAPVVAGAGNTGTDSGASISRTNPTASGKGGEGSPPNIDAADRARFVQRVSQAFRAANDRGGQVRLRLHPPELGSLRVELKVIDGVMSARMEAESAAARDLLAEHLPVLRQRLADHGIRVERFELDLMGGNGEGSSQQAFQPPTDGQGRRHHEMTPPRRRTQAVEAPARSQGTAVGVRNANGIDVII